MDNILSPEKLTHTWLEDTLALLPAHLRLNRVHSIEELAQKARAFWQECDMGGAGNG